MPEPRDLVPFRLFFMAMSAAVLAVLTTVQRFSGFFVFNHAAYNKADYYNQCQKYYNCSHGDLLLLCIISDDNFGFTSFSCFEHNISDSFNKISP